MKGCTRTLFTHIHIKALKEGVGSTGSLPLGLFMMNCEVSTKDCTHKPNGYQT